MKLGTVAIGGKAIPILFSEQGQMIDLQIAIAGREGDRHFYLGYTYGAPITLVDLIATPDRSLVLFRSIESNPERFSACVVESGSATPMAPIPRPPKNVFCVGRNYADHVKEDNESRDKATPIPEVPQFFTKPYTAIVGNHDSVRYDERVTKRLDYEVELAVVIGKPGRDITAANALDHVFGYSIVNDITARDLQRRQDQWFKGKALDTSCPMGPWIVTADEISDPHDLLISLSVNDESRQSATTADMIFKIPQLIESLSAGLSLEAGDVIATGTPSGVGYAMNPRQFLADGDVVVCKVEKIGTLTNRIAAV